MTTEPKDVLGGDVAAEQRSAQSPPPVREAVAWHKMTDRKPEPGYKFVALFDDGSGAWLGFAHDGGVIDSDGDDHTKMPNAEWWAYLPSGFRLSCEDHPCAEYEVSLPDHVPPPLADPLPVSREAVEAAVLSAMRQYRSASPDRRGEYAPMIVKEATDDILAALTGETSRE